MEYSKTNRQNFTDEIKLHPERFHCISLEYTSHRCDKIMYKLFRQLKAITPLYKLHVAWKNKTVSQYYSPRLKLSVNQFNKPGVTYSFQCPCSLSYIGESKRQLVSRIKEHNRPSSQTAISDHIYGSTTKNIQPCIIYKNALTNTYGDRPNPSDKLNFIKNCFKVIQNSLTNYNFRKDFEAIQIILNKPKLNAQVAHRNISII